MPAGATIREFLWSDLEQWSSLFTVLHVASPSAGTPDLEFTRRFLSQPGCEPERNCFVAETQGSLVGYVLLAPELPIGRAVSSGGVMPSYRVAGIGRSLLSKAIERARQLRVDVLHVQAGEDSAGARHLLETSGFRLVREYWKLRWEGGEAPVYNLPSHFGLRSFSAGSDEALLTELQNDSFAGTWGFCPNTVEQIAARVGLRPWDAEGILIAQKGTVPAAYNWTTRERADPTATGRIAMTAVHPSYRSQGLGRAILLAGIEYLKRSGASKVELEVDAENSLARDLYLSVGFHSVGRTLWYEMRFAT